jgi:tetratricopeptide (TPR) repeat protein
MEVLVRLLLKLALFPVLVLFVAAAPQNSVSVREEKMSIPTWEIGPPTVHSQFPNPTGPIYPYTLNETLTDRKVDKTYNAVVLENRFIKVLVLPEIGGRLHGALDKTNNYTWLYWQPTIKPGLISMTGAWISGGIEWNFPHGHRPSCFMPVDHRIVNHADGSATVWVGETEPVYRMRWLVGMTIFPEKSYIRCDYILVNPTDQKQSYQFWATAATHANEWTQAQYPGDMVTGHGKHEFWNWPVNDGVDLTWWKNVPNASSFFAFNNPSDWFGSYDHKAQGGTVHVANHYTMPGKKLWTWGSGPSGRIWEDILTEGGGPYFEPQAGAWSDNQPDNHWLAPNEVRTTHDYWYPVRDTRGYHNANEDFALNTDLKDGMAFGAVYSTGIVKDCKIILKNTRSGQTIFETTTSVSPDKPFTREVKVASDVTVFDLHLGVYDPAGRLLIELQQQPPKKVELPPGQKDPGDPKKMNQDQLYYAGEWLDKFVRRSEGLVYYEEALKRDPKDCRVNTEMGFLALKQGRWKEALNHLDTALERDPDNSRIYFGKGLALAGMSNYKEAYDQFYRATYTYDYFSPASLNLARISMRWGDFRKAIELSEDAESQNGRFADIPALRAAAYRHLDDYSRSQAAAEKAMTLDPMNPMGSYEKALVAIHSGRPADPCLQLWLSIMRGDVQNYIELATGYAAAGHYRDADEVLAKYTAGKEGKALYPMVDYLRGYFNEMSGDPSAALSFYERAALGPAEYTNPHRLEEKAALDAALQRRPQDARAHLFLGNLLYAIGQREEGFAQWKKAVECDDNLALAWRNVAYADNSLLKDPAASFKAYQKTMQLAPNDGRALFEMDQVAQAMKIPAAQRLDYIEKHPQALNSRDDLVARWIDLCIEIGGEGNLKAALDRLKTRRFNIWEGGYDIHDAWIEVNQQLGDLAMNRKDYPAALQYFKDACEYPKNLGVAPRTPDFRANVNWNLARVYTAMGQNDLAAACLKQILAEKYGKPSLGTYYQALAQRMLKNDAASRVLLDSLEKRAREMTSGGFEYRGDPETIGHMLLAQVLEAKGDKAGAAVERRKALDQNPKAMRITTRQAQIEYAGAHQ